MSTSCPAPGLRERKNRRTRLAIVRAAAELTIESGYAAATIPRIAERADVAPRTVSTWFPSKDDILFEGTQETVARGIAYLRDDDGDVVDRLLAWLIDEAARGVHDPEFAGLRDEAIAHDPELRARARQFYERLQLELAQAAGRWAGAPESALGPKLFAGAAIAFLEQLAAIAADAPVAGFEDPTVAGGLAYLRTALEAVAGGEERPATVAASEETLTK